MPSPRLSPSIARLAGLGAFAVAGAILLALALAIFGTRANQPGQTGGIDDVNTMITWIAFTVIALALIAVHVVMARQLLAESRGERRGV
jgi:hypothetical protein